MLHSGWGDRRMASLQALGGRDKKEGMRTLKWDPSQEEFLGDDTANRVRWRPRRSPWSV